jgi:hypothetical protein
VGKIDMVNEGKYIYCITEAKGKPEQFGPIGIGGRGDKLYSICFDDIAAVVSNSPIKKYSVARENLTCHERAIEEVMKTQTVLPVRFCTIAEVENKVRKILEKEHDRFFSLLKDMEGKKELGLKAVFKEEAIYKEILADYEEIRMEKEKMAKEPRSAHAHQKLMQIGKMVEAALQEEKAKWKGDILSSLVSLALEVKTNNTYGERMILNAAFLVEKTKEAAFDQKVNELADQYGDKITFKYVGTLPPFNFVNIEINTEDY